MPAVVVALAGLGAGRLVVFLVALVAAALARERTAVFTALGPRVDLRAGLRASAFFLVALLDALARLDVFFWAAFAAMGPPVEPVTTAVV